jgi:hypothetical protein
MQIALVAVVLLAGMWFTVLRPKSDAGPAPVAAQPTAPGVKGLTTAVGKAKGAAAASDATNARIQQSTGGSTAASTPAVAAKAGSPAATKPAKPAAATKPAAQADPSGALLSFLSKGKVVVLLFHGDGADDQAARQAVHHVASKDRGVVSAYAPIAKVAQYQAITSGIDVSTAPTILVIGKDRQAKTLTGFVDAGVLWQTIGDVRRHAAASAKKK